MKYKAESCVRMMAMAQKTPGKLKIRSYGRGENEKSIPPPGYERVNFIGKTNEAKSERKNAHTVKEA